MTRRLSVLIAIMFALLGLVVFWCYGYMTDQRNGAHLAQRDLISAQLYSTAIKKLRDRPNVASEQEQLHTETIRNIEKAAKEAGLQSKNLVRITPEGSHRIEKTVYREKPTLVLLRKVTLKQLVTLVYKLVSLEQSLHPKSLRISAPGLDDSSDLWEAEITLTYLIYDPPEIRR